MYTTLNQNTTVYEANYTVFGSNGHILNAQQTTEVNTSIDMFDNTIYHIELTINYSNGAYQRSTAEIKVNNGLLRIDLNPEIVKVDFEISTNCSDGSHQRFADRCDDYPVNEPVATLLMAILPRMYQYNG